MSHIVFYPCTGRALHVIDLLTDIAPATRVHHNLGNMSTTKTKSSSILVISCISAQVRYLLNYMTNSTNEWENFIYCSQPMNASSWFTLAVSSTYTACIALHIDHQCLRTSYDIPQFVDEHVYLHWKPHLWTGVKLRYILLAKCIHDAVTTTCTYNSNIQAEIIIFFCCFSCFKYQVEYIKHKIKDNPWLCYTRKEMDTKQIRACALA